MIIDSPIISGSQLSSGPLFQIGDVQISGSLSVSGSISGGTVSGSVASASYAGTASYINPLVQNVQITGSTNILYSPTSLTDNVLVVKNNRNDNTGFQAATLALDGNTPGGHVDIRLGSTTPTGLRMYASNETLTASPLGAGFQFFNISDPYYPGQVYFDAGANNNGGLIFRSAVTSGTITEAMRVNSSRQVLIANSSGTQNTPGSERLNVNGGVVASSFTGSLQGTASFATTASGIAGGTNNYVSVWSGANSLVTGSIADNKNDEITFFKTRNPNYGDLIVYAFTEPRLFLSSSNNDRLIVYNSYGQAALSYENSLGSNYLIRYSGYDTKTITIQTNRTDKVTINSSGSVQFNSYTTNGLLKTISSNGTLAIATGSVDYVTPSEFSTVSSSYASASGSLSTRVTNLESTSSTVSSSFASTSGSIAGRVTLIEGQYATTGSNTFTKRQYISDVSNAIGFTSTASLYTDGGLRVAKDFFVSGNAYFNNVTVYGTSSIQYITSSQIAIGANLITLNTNTPSIRFGGISVFDSGSNNQSTGSLFWDSEKDRWIYSNPSGSTYDGGMLISGPRNTSGLGNEVGTTSCALMMGQGGDHITSSAIFSYGNATCFYGQSFISSSGNACFGGSATIARNLAIGTGSSASGLTISGISANSAVDLANCTTSTGRTMRLVSLNQGGFAVEDLTANGCARLTIDSSGITCFSSIVCSCGFVACGGTAVFNGYGRTTNYQYADMTNTSGRLIIGVDGQTGCTIIPNYSQPYSVSFGTDQNKFLHLFTSDVPRLTITGNGSAVIGNITPKYDWYTQSYLGLQINGSTTVWGRGSDSHFSSNYYVKCCSTTGVASDTYIANGYANDLWFDNNAGQLRYRVGACGVADNAISWTTPFQICPNGYTSINTTADGFAMLCLVSTGGDAGIYIRGGATNNGGWTIQAQNACSFVIVDRTAGSNPVRLQISSGGNMSIGAATTPTKLYVVDSNTANCGCTIARFDNSGCSLRLTIVDESTTGGCPGGIFSNTGYGLGLYSCTPADYGGVKFYNVNALTFHVSGCGRAAIGGFACGNSYKLQIYGSSAVDGVGIFICDTNSNKTYTLRNDGPFSIRDASAGVDRFVISSAGIATFSGQVCSTYLYATGNPAFRFINTPSQSGGVAPGCVEVFSTSFYANQNSCTTIGTAALSDSQGWRAIFKGTYSNNWEGGGLTSSAIMFEVTPTFCRIPLGTTPLYVSLAPTTCRLQVYNPYASAIANFTGTVEIYQYVTGVAPSTSAVFANNVGIGTGAPNNRLELQKTTSQSAMLFINQCTADEATIRFKSTHDANSDYRVGASILYNSAFEVYSVNCAVDRFWISQCGAIMIATGTDGAVNSADPVHKIGSNGNGTSYARLMIQERTGCWISFNNGSGTNYGVIQVSGAGVSYGSNSDYRLKTNVRNMISACGLSRIMCLRPVIFDWIQHCIEGEGFIAHELQEYIPNAVSGDKDAVNEHGYASYQSVDAKNIVPSLVKAIQEHQCTICSQASIINTLKACLGIS